MPATHICIRPPIPGSVLHTAIVRAEDIIAVTHLPYRSILQHRAHRASAIQKTKFVIDQSQHADRLRPLNHLGRLLGSHSHRFLTKYSLPMFKRCESNIHVRRWRSDDTYEVYIAMRY